MNAITKHWILQFSTDLSEVGI